MTGEVGHDQKAPPAFGTSCRGERGRGLSEHAVCRRAADVDRTMVHHDSAVGALLQRIRTRVRGPTHGCNFIAVVARM